MEAFVVDASMALAWHFRDERTDFVRRVFTMTASHAIIVPVHWFAEVANSIVMGERRGRATPRESATFLATLDELTIDVDELPPRAQFARLLPIARAHRLTVYDSFYLELAERRGVALASLDGALCDAARSVGVAIVTDGA